MPTVMQWLRHLEAKVEEQRTYAIPYEARYRNEWVLPFVVREYREVYGDQVDALRPPRTGTAAITVDALTERLTVQGAGSDDTAVARLLQQAWEDCDLDVMHREAHREAFIKRTAFAQVSRSTDSRAIVGIESPEQMAVHRMQVPPYDVDAALKVWPDEWTNQLQGYLWLPGRGLTLQWSADALPDPEGSDVYSHWRVVREEPLDGVPVVEFPSRARLLTKPRSEIEPIETEVDIADLVEGLLVFAGHFGAVPIRYATGLEVPRDPKDPTKALLGPDGKPILGFKPRADHFWATTSKDAKFGQLEPANLASFIAWANHVGSRIRAQTSVASTYYSIDLKSHMSAELLKTDEAPMVRRVRSMGHDGGTLNSAWRKVLRHILRVEQPGSRARVWPRWADPETRIEAQATDSFQKLVASGLGVAAAAEKVLGWDPDLVERAVKEAQAAEERVAFLADQFAPLTGEERGATSTGLVAL